MKDDMKQDKKLIKKAFSMHDKQEHKGEHTNLSSLKKGGKLKMIDKKKNPGLSKLPTDVRNKMGFMKTGGKCTKMAKGGVTSSQAKAVGRNLARAHNQKSGSK